MRNLGLTHMHYSIKGCHPGGSDGKESACNARDPGLGRSRGEGNGNPLQYSCLENSMCPWNSGSSGRLQFMGSQRVRHN